MNLTAFGKFLRGYRLEKLMRLKDMAGDLNLSSAFLSAVETGAKEIPEDMVNKLIKYYDFSEQEKQLLFKAVDETKTNTIIDMPDSLDDRYLIGAFARNLNNLDSEKKNRILNMLKGSDE